MDQKEHIEDIGSHEAKLKLDGPYLNYQDNVVNDEVNALSNDLKLHQSPITISYTKKFQDVLQGFMKTILANHEHEDPKCHTSSHVSRDGHLKTNHPTYHLI